MTPTPSEPRSDRPSLWERCGDTTPRDRRNSIGILVAIALWGVCFVGATYSIKHELVSAGPVAWLVATLPVVTGIGVIAAYGRYLRDADELQRMIHLRALALAFAIGWLAVTCYPLFERLGAPAVDASDFGAVMAVCYSLAVLRGARHYW